MNLNSPSFKTRQAYYRWHRRLGIASAIFVVILLVTGILLNHTEGLQLDSRFTHSSLLRKMYGLPVNLDISVAVAHQQLISQFQDKIYLNEQPVDSCQGELVGAIGLNKLAGFEQSLLVACSNGLLWLDITGEYLDFITTSSINLDQIVKLGTTTKHFPIIDDGKIIYAINLDLLTLTPNPQSGISWSQLQQADTSIAKQLDNAYYQDAISWEQLLLDMHSGRLFGGQIGVLLMDASAVILLLLVLSGLYMWWIKR